MHSHRATVSIATGHNPVVRVDLPSYPHCQNRAPYCTKFLSNSRRCQVRQNLVFSSSCFFYTFLCARFWRCWWWWANPTSVACNTRLAHDREDENTPPCLPSVLLEWPPLGTRCLGSLTPGECTVYGCFVYDTNIVYDTIKGIVALSVSFPETTHSTHSKSPR